MGLLSSLLGMAVKEATSDVVKKATDAGRVVTGSVNQGIDYLTEGTRAVMSPFMSGNDERSRAARQAFIERHEARRWGLSTVSRQPTPEELAAREKLKEYKKEVQQYIIRLDEEIENLKGSIFSLFYSKKKCTKEMKKRELEELFKFKTWETFQENAKSALIKKQVITGRHSRTRDLLQRIVGDSIVVPVNAVIAAPN